MRTRHILLTATLLAGGIGVAAAQNAATYDPNQLPAIQGKVAQFSLTPRGDVDGVILDDGTQVHLPPHLSAQLVAAVKPGDSVTIHGLKARAIPVLQALSIADDRTGQTVMDQGPPQPPPPRQPASSQWLSVQGRVRAPLYGPRGDMNGALLEDGTQVHVPPNQAPALSQEFQPGQTLAAQGYGVAGPYGRSIAAQRIGANPEQLVQLAPPPPRPHPHGPGSGPGRGLDAGPGQPPPPPADH